jgi:hypothetical protein
MKMQKFLLQISQKLQIQTDLLILQKEQILTKKDRIQEKKILTETETTRTEDNSVIVVLFHVKCENRYP